jgi:hypothetical protein
MMAAGSGDDIFASSISADGGHDGSKRAEKRIPQAGGRTGLVRTAAPTAPGLIRVNPLRRFSAMLDERATAAEGAGISEPDRKFVEILC